MILDVYAKGLQSVGGVDLYGAVEGVYLHGIMVRFPTV